MDETKTPVEAMKNFGKAMRGTRESRRREANEATAALVDACYLAGAAVKRFGEVLRSG